jgi:hypothetical protein
VLSALGPETVAEPEEVLLIDAVQHGDSRSLDNLVLERRYRSGRFLPSAFGMYVRREGSARYAPR